MYHFAVDVEISNLFSFEYLSGSSIQIFGIWQYALIGLNRDPDPAFNFNADPDPGSETNADPSGSWSDFYVSKSWFLNEKYTVLYVGTGR